MRHLISFSEGLLGHRHTTKSSVCMPPCVLPLTPLLTAAVSSGDDLVMWWLSASSYSWNFLLWHLVILGPIQTGQLLSVVTVRALGLNCIFTTKECKEAKTTPSLWKSFNPGKKISRVWQSLSGQIHSFPEAQFTFVVYSCGTTVQFKCSAVGKVHEKAGKGRHCNNARILIACQ